MLRRLTRDDPAYAGQAAYTPPVLAVYDWLFLGLEGRLVWRCPRQTVLDWYDTHVSANHLDFGVGTGYFLDHCRFPSPSPAITLVDANPTPLRWTARRLRRYQPRTHLADVLKPLDLGGQRFDSIGLSHVLHCLPGSFPAKASRVFQNLKPLLHEGGVLFGVTIPGRGVAHGTPARLLLRLYNALGVLSNAEDDLVGLQQALEEAFARHQLAVHGSMVLFAAGQRDPSARLRMPRNGASG